MIFLPNNNRTSGHLFFFEVCSWFDPCPQHQRLVDMHGPHRAKDISTAIYEAIVNDPLLKPSEIGALEVRLHYLFFMHNLN